MRWKRAFLRVAMFPVGPTSAPDTPTQGQLVHVKPNLRPNVPKLRHVEPQLGLIVAQVGANWPEFGAS